MALDHSDADVLTILDTCSAGAIVKSAAGDPARTFEVLAATTRDAPTAGPGPRSFTKALIDSLEERLESLQETPFTTFDLNVAIMTRRQNQRSQVYPRHQRQHSPRFIKLAPLPREDTPKASVLSTLTSHLTLRLAIDDFNSLTRERVESLARELAQTCKKNKELGVRAFEWVEYRANTDGQRQQENERLRQVIKEVERRWKHHVRRQRAISSAGKDQVQARPETLALSHSTKLFPDTPATPPSSIPSDSE
jgi:hypothetical protein